MIWQSLALGRQSSPMLDPLETWTVLVNRNTAFLPPESTPRKMISGDCAAGSGASRTMFESTWVPWASLVSTFAV